MRKYLPITQQPYCCVTACLQMVMYRRGINLIEQEDIAYELGLTVPKNDVHLFKKARTGQKPSSGWGTQIQKEEFSVPKFFKNHNILLNFSIKNDFADASELRNYLNSHLGDDVDVMLCFDYGVLWETDHRGGHVCIMESIDGDEIVLVDPERNVPKRRIVKIDKLYKAIDFHGPHNSTGVWLCKSKRTTAELSQIF